LSLDIHKHIQTAMAAVKKSAMEEKKEKYSSEGVLGRRLFDFFTNNKSAGIFDYVYDVDNQECIFYVTCIDYQELQKILKADFSDVEITFKFVGVSPAIYLPESS
jgi:hypothetical protein